MKGHETGLPPQLWEIMLSLMGQVYEVKASGDGVEERMKRRESHPTLPSCSSGGIEVVLQPTIPYLPEPHL